MGHWQEWRDLSPLIEVARSHAPDATVTALRDASALLRDGRARTADQRLAEASTGPGRPWIAAARANAAALYFTTCIRGMALRLAEGKAPPPTERAVDFSQETRVEPGDVSLEALLTNLEEGFSSGIPALVTQTRIARARIASFAQRCPANPDVETMARQTTETDLAVLAAEGHLTPDLAYLWAGVQMARFSGAAARPFLLQALEGGFEHPAVFHMLAATALEQRELEPAEEFAGKALLAYEQQGDRSGTAQIWHLRSEIARARGGKDASKHAVAHAKRALDLDPGFVPALLTLAAMALEQGRESDAMDIVHRQLGPLLGTKPLDAATLEEGAATLEGLVIAVEEPAMVQLVRDALLLRIDADADPARRGLRYFFAATLDARLQEFQLAHGHGVLARDEFAESTLEPPMDVEAFLQRVQP